jgi:pSer/pThr/pTyr-binding forkhead associated (FHA) protein/tetratricopeptide (TPR) repeat protein
MWKLCIEDDEGNQTVVPLIRDEITIGRQEGNTIRLTERNVSRKHAKLMRTEEGIYVEPLEPRYGIKRNGERIADKAEFREGDIFLIGDYRLTLQSERAVQAPPMPRSGPPGISAPPMPAAASGGFASETTQITRRPANEGTEIMPTMPAKLVVVSSNFAGQEFPLTRREMVIGRGEECDIIVDHRSVSQTHAKVAREAGNVYQIIDLNSKNGVRIGGEKYTHVHIKRGDIIELGHVKFRFVEPGENYVFTPQSILPDGEDLPSADGSGKSKVGKIMAAVAVVALLLGGGIIYATQDKGAGAEAAGTEAALVAGAAPAADAAPAALSEPVAKGLAKAEEQIKAGEIEKAIGVLETLQDTASTPQDKEKIDAALAQARTEKPFRNQYIVLKDDLQKKSYADALRNINKIPKHSVFQRLIEEEGLKDKAITGGLEAAQAAFDSKKWDASREIVDEILLVDGEQGAARAMLAQLDERSKPVVVAAKPAEPRDVVKEPKEAKPKDTKPKEPVEPEKIDPAEAKALFDSAKSKVFKADWSGVINDCGKSLKAGYSDCYRLMGLAYKNLNDQPKACKSYARYLKTKPANGSAVEGVMAKLGCDEL